MKLLGSTTSPYVRKVRVVMAEKKLDYAFVNEDVWSADTTISESNPLGKVPCLIMEGAELIPPVGRERAEIKTWEALADGLMDAAILARLEATWTGRTKAQRSQAWIDRQLDKVHATVKAMSSGLGDKPFCGGIHFSLADVAVGCALGYLDFRFPQIDWRSEYPNLVRLHDKLMQRASFADTVPA
jgi:glutathione S-transferase